MPLDKEVTDVYMKVIKLIEKQSASATFEDYILNNIANIDDRTLFAYHEHINKTISHLTNVATEIDKELLRREP